MSEKCSLHEVVADVLLEELALPNWLVIDLLGCAPRILHLPLVVALRRIPITPKVTRSKVKVSNLYVGMVILEIIDQNSQQKKHIHFGQLLLSQESITMIND